MQDETSSVWHPTIALDEILLWASLLSLELPAPHSYKRYVSKYPIILTDGEGGCYIEFLLLLYYFRLTSPI